MSDHFFLDSGLKFEEVNQCPVCGSEKKTLLYENLHDYICKEINSKYKFWLCLSCRSGYYSPRPTKDTVHLLYKNYATHEDINLREEYSSLKWPQKIRRKISNSYANRRYGTADEPAYQWGYLILEITPKYKNQIDFGFRFVPRPMGQRKLLDFGCGNGQFLKMAEKCGYVPYGMDFDEHAISKARKYFDKVYCGDIEEIDGGLEFDVITVSHVIEHLYNPNFYIEQFFKLLKPGGFLYMETPNLDSIGHGYFGESWRGLEPPRHIQVFNTESLADCLSRAGFRFVRVPAKNNPVDFICKSSNQIRFGCLGDRRNWVRRFFEKVFIAVQAKLLTGREEFTILIAYKPKPQI